jgi:hypothetical protein
MHFVQPGQKWIQRKKKDLDNKMVINEQKKRKDQEKKKQSMQTNLGYRE